MIKIPVKCVSRSLLLKRAHHVTLEYYILIKREASSWTKCTVIIFLSFILFGFSGGILYSYLIVNEEAIAKNQAHFNIDSVKETERKPPSIEIFSAPPPTYLNLKKSTESAIASWKKLGADVRITLIGNDKTVKELARCYNVSFDNTVDYSFLGRPLFGSMINRVNDSNADIAVLINADIILLSDFIPTLRKLYGKMPHFLATGARYDVAAFHPSRSEEGCAYARRRGKLHNNGGMDFWAWTIGGRRLVKERIPPFNFARGKYDNWFLHEVIASKSRPIVDVSEVVTSVHVHHSYRHSLELETVASSTINRTKREQMVNSSHIWTDNKLSNFEVFMNTHMSLNFGSFKTGLGTPLHAPWKLVRCYENNGSCLIQRYNPGICPCEYSSGVKNTQISPRQDINGRPVTRRSIPSYDKARKFEPPVRVTDHYRRNPHFGLPLTLKDALERTAENGTIFVTTGNSAYKNIVMNWVCHLRRIRISNFIVAALDRDMYRFSITRGVAVYYENSFFNRLFQLDPSTKGNLDTVGFKTLTKLKTRIVRRILMLGFHVVWSDCDIVYFRNPLSYLHGMQGDIIVQSNAPDEEVANNRRRLNSGFYFVRSNQKMIEAMDRIISLEDRNEHMTEQPCFYFILCGNGGRFRRGSDICSNGRVKVRFLPRRTFPNGVTNNLWHSNPGEIPKRCPNCYILHNNWVLGMEMKEERMRRHGFIIYDQLESICRYNLFDNHRKSDLNNV